MRGTAFGKRMIWSEVVDGESIKHPFTPLLQIPLLKLLFVMLHNRAHSGYISGPVVHGIASLGDSFSFTGMHWL